MKTLLKRTLFLSLLLGGLTFLSFPTLNKETKQVDEKDSFSNQKICAIDPDTKVVDYY